MTGEEILDRASEVNLAQDDMNAHVRITEDDEITEVKTVGEDTYLVRFDGDEPGRETLHYEGKGYVRDFGDSSWEREPLLDSLLGRGEPLIGDVDFESWSGEVTRLADETVDGQTVFRVRIEISGPIDDFEDDLEAVAERFGVDDLQQVPTELLPDEISGTIDLWITIDSFETIRVHKQTMAFIEGEELFDSEETFELLEIGPSVALPMPLPE